MTDIIYSIGGGQKESEIPVPTRSAETKVQPHWASDALETGVEEGIQWCIKKTRFWINGYAKLPDGHQWIGLHHSDTYFDKVDVHGGVTFAEQGWIGFDTMHSWDHWEGSTVGFNEGTDLSFLKYWTQEMVVEEAKRLARQVASAYKKGDK
jgi:hypothetical protein